MTYIWDLYRQQPDDLAVISEKGIKYTYSQLQSRVDILSEKFPKSRSLVLLKCQNDLNFVVMYLACLQSGNPAILIDSSLNQLLCQKIINTYQPNWIVNGENWQRYNQVELPLHRDLGILLSTSGSTGSPKLVRLSKNNLQTNAKSIIQYLNILNTDTAISTLPFSYSYGLSLLNSHLCAGGSIVLTTSSVMTREFWNLVTTNSVSSLAGVPYTYQMLMKMRYERLETSSFKYLTQAGGRLDPLTLEYFSRLCAERSQKFYVMYGQTEATARISYLPPEDLDIKVGSVGIPIPGGDLFIKPSNGELVKAPFVEGEVVYRGGNVMLGYAEKVEDLAIGDENNGLLCTGDVGYFDSDGFLYITGRSSRFIKIFGFRLSLDAIELWLSERGLESVCLGSDDTLIVVIESGNAYMQTEVMYDLSKVFHIPLRSIEFRILSLLPRTVSGKIDIKGLNIGNLSK